MSRSAQEVAIEDYGLSPNNTHLGGFDVWHLPTLKRRSWHLEKEDAKVALAQYSFDDARREADAEKDEDIREKVRGEIANNPDAWS